MGKEQTGASAGLVMLCFIPLVTATCMLALTLSLVLKWNLRFIHNSAGMIQKDRSQEKGAHHTMVGPHGKAPGSVRSRGDVSKRPYCGFHGRKD